MPEQIIVDASGRFRIVPTGPVGPPGPPGPPGPSGSGHGDGVQIYIFTEDDIDEDGKVQVDLSDLSPNNTIAQIMLPFTATVMEIIGSPDPQTHAPWDMIVWGNPETMIESFPSTSGIYFPEDIPLSVWFFSFIKGSAEPVGEPDRWFWFVRIDSMANLTRQTLGGLLNRPLLGLGTKEVNIHEITTNPDTSTTIGSAVLGESSVIVATVTDDPPDENSPGIYTNAAALAHTRLVIRQDSTGGHDVSLPTGPTFIWLGDPWVPSLDPDSEAIIDFWRISRDDTNYEVPEIWHARVVSIDGVLE